MEAEVDRLFSELNLLRVKEICEKGKNQIRLQNFDQMRDSVPLRWRRPSEVEIWEEIVGVLDI